MTPSRRVAVRVDGLGQLAQIIHQAYHRDSPGTWRTCAYPACQRFMALLEAEPSTGRTSGPWILPEDEKRR